MTTTTPANSPANSVEQTRSFYDRISKAYDFIADASEHRAREAGQRALALKSGERVLEIGFGTGNTAVDLARLVGPTGNVSGIDISPGMLEVAREKLAEAQVPCELDLRVGDARQLPYADRTFDAAFLSFTLELFSDQDIPRVLSELRRVLRAGGRLGIVAMGTVEPGGTDSLLERTYQWTHRHFPHIVDCRPIDTTRWLSEAGFQIVSKDVLEIWTMPVHIVLATAP